jgi:predicted phage terminase large subunit-like protein
VLIDHAWLEQVDTAGRVKKVRDTAEEDGTNCHVITIPRDPGSAGADTVFFMQQEQFPEFTVVARPTTQSKEVRALSFSAAVNDGLVDMVEGDWNKKVLTALRDFPLSDFDDPVDAGADMFNQLYETYRKGLVLKNFNPLRNLAFGKRSARSSGTASKCQAISPSMQALS